MTYPGSISWGSSNVSAAVQFSGDHLKPQSRWASSCPPKSALSLGHEFKETATVCHHPSFSLKLRSCCLPGTTKEMNGERLTQNCPKRRKDASLLVRHTGHHPIERFTSLWPGVRSKTRNAPGFPVPRMIVTGSTPSDVSELCFSIKDHWPCHHSILL